jgi:hypothetical protein
MPERMGAVRLLLPGDAQALMMKPVATLAMRASARAMR